MDKIREELSNTIVSEILFHDGVNEGYFRREVLKLLVNYDKSKDEDLKIVLKSLIAKDYIAAIEILSEILEGE